MSQNSQVEDSLKAELTEFLKLYGFLTYEEGTPGRRWCTLMSARLLEEIVDTLIKLIVGEWMETGITKMSEFESTQNMNYSEVMAMVKEHVWDHLRILSAGRRS
ncbi:hypothetical protein BGX38DRAFT_1332077 [Terfezia claveryi]|nr:hypothetical protein BGX38DRAFT_1332077 [Terfezia claveryi]